MANERLGLSFSVNAQEAYVSGYRDKIHQGLDLDGASFLKLSRGVEDGLLDDFARILMATSAHLKKPVPEVELIHGWSQPLEGYEQNHELREIFANAYLDENYPHGIIFVSPFYLKAEITHRMGINQGFMFPLEFVLAHEDYHIWQISNQYEKTVEDYKVLRTEGLAAWNLTQTEIDANEFANSWIQDQHSTGDIS